MKHSATLFLKVAVWIVGLGVFAICGLLILPLIVRNEAGYYTPLLALMCASAIPFFLALYQTIKLLGFIDENKAFSTLSTKALGAIKLYALVIAVLYSVALPYIYYAADRDDAPGVIVIALVVIFGALVVAGFAAVLRLLLINAIEMKKENDLTV